MTAHEILVKARDKIKDPSKWGQGVRRLARREMCAYDALREVRHVPEEADQAAAVLARAMGAPEECPPMSAPVWVTRWNDNHTHAEVMDAFDRAIAATAHTED